MKTRLIVIAALAVLAASGSNGAVSERPQPVDSSPTAENNPELPPQPAPKPVDPLAADKRNDSPLTSFERLDTDKDGKLSKTELGDNEGAGMDFSRIDRDGDGSISREEWNAHWQERKDPRDSSSIAGASA